MRETILVTGNLGYIGSVMVPILTERGFNVIGYDCGYYSECSLIENRQDVIKQTGKDIRDCEVNDFKNVDYVFHLASLSNDPLGEFNSKLTEDINFNATVKLAECAKSAGVKRFIYASSQSIYGISDISQEIDEESDKNPLTAYAKTKWKSENELSKMCSEEFSVTYMRPATAYGASPNLRCDIVFNSFVANAYTSRCIEIKSDGTPWRPMTHVRDITEAFIASVKAPVEKVYNQAFNVGTKDNNYTVAMLARIATNLTEDSRLIFTNEHTDSRSYRVSSDKIARVLGQYYNPQWDIEKGGQELMNYFKQVSLTEEIFKSYKCNRLQCLKMKIEKGVIDEELKIQN